MTVKTKKRQVVFTSDRALGQEDFSSVSQAPHGSMTAAGRSFGVSKVAASGALSNSRLLEHMLALLAAGPWAVLG